MVAEVNSALLPDSNAAAQKRWTKESWEREHGVPPPTITPSNRCGLIPVEYNVVVALDPVKEKTAGGIILPDKVQEVDKISAQEGTLVAASPLAFSYEKWPEGSRVPTIGDRVLFKRHAGNIHTREVVGEKREFRLLSDKEIIAIVEEA